MTPPTKSNGRADRRYSVTAGSVPAGPNSRRSHQPSPSAPTAGTAVHAANTSNVIVTIAWTSSRPWSMPPVSKAVGERPDADAERGQRPLVLRERVLVVGQAGPDLVEPDVETR